MESYDKNHEEFSCNIDDFPKRLLIARRYRGYSSKMLASLCNFRPSTISDYENGKNRPTLANFLTLCEVLDTHPNYLYGLSDQIEYNNYAVLLEKIFKKIGRDDQGFLYKIIKDFYKQYYKKKKKKAKKPVTYNF